MGQQGFDLYARISRTEREETPSAVGNRLAMRNGAECAKRLAERPRSSSREERPEVMGGTIIFRHALGAPGCGYFGRTGEGNDEGGAMVGFALHG
jgi:hypothetical protein